MLAWLVVPAIAGQQDGWRTVRPGHWVELRTRTELVGPQGATTQSSERTVVSTLMCRSAAEYLLRIESSIESAGRVVTDEPRDLRVQLAEHDDTQSHGADAVGEAVVDLQSHSVTCRVLRESVEVQGESMIRIRYINPDVYPYVFRRELRRAAIADRPETIVRLTEVMGLDVPMLVANKMHACAVIRTTEYHEEGVTTQWETTSQQVPGELIRRSTTDRDSTGRLVRRTATELVAQGNEWERIDTSLWNREGNRPQIFRWGSVEFWGLHRGPLRLRDRR